MFDQKNIKTAGEHSSCMLHLEKIIATLGDDHTDLMQQLEKAVEKNKKARLQEVQAKKNVQTIQVNEESLENPDGMNGTIEGPQSKKPASCVKNGAVVILRLEMLLNSADAHVNNVLQLLFKLKSTLI